ncbi:hypothetical protein C8Q80DRAFT_1301076 [Daedaleopsis nitida]|nr:hypothetical protein C8Q80DRAFT_1301076 [Daedaleopsis nitida]
MHPIFYNYDVVAHVCMSVVNDAEEEDVDFRRRLEMEADVRKWLVNWALVCKWFCSPALDALWWRLDNLVPLLRLLPCFTPMQVQQKDETKSETIYLLKGEPTSLQWAIFQSYAKRVRVLNFPKQAAVTPHIVSQLSKWNKGEPLLPGLKELTWLPASPTDTSALALGASQLELLHIVLDCIELPDEIRWLPMRERVDYLRDPSTRTVGDRDMEKLLGTYAEQTLRLRTLELTTHIHPLCLAPPLARFKGLEHLYMRDVSIDVDLLRTISTLRGLETLFINFQPVHGHVRPQPIEGFPHLVQLELCARAENMAFFFDIVNPLEQLASLALDYPNGVPENSVSYRAPIERLHARGHARKLVSVTLEISTRWRTQHETIGDLVRPLLAIRTLERVAVNATRSEYQVTEENLERMARAWPRLTRLLVRWASRGARAQGAATPPLRALAHFEKHCPALNGLILSHIDVGAPLPEPPVRPGTHGLEILAALESYPIQDPKMVARYVFYLFPRVLMTVPGPQPAACRMETRVAVGSAVENCLESQAG